MKKNRLFHITLLVAGLMVLAGVFILVAYHFSGKGSHSQKAKATPPSKIALEILIRPLLGEAPEKSAQLAIERGELDAARSIVENSPFMSRKTQLGLRLSIAEKYAATKDTKKSARLYEEAAAIAFLSPSLSDQYRAQALLETGSGLAAIGRKDEARVCLKGVETLLYESPHFQPAQRLQLFKRARKLYSALGMSAPQKQLPEKFEPVQPLPLSLQVKVPPDIPDEFLAVERERREALQTALKSPTDENWGKVIHAFLKEDQIKEHVFATRIPNEPQLAAKLSWLRERAIWRWTKYAIARKAFGISLVPQWEKSIADVRFKLVKAYEEMYAGYGDMAVALPTSEEAEAGWTIVLRNEMLDAWLGYYPDAPMSAINDQMTEHDRRLSGKWKEELCPTVNLDSKEPLPFGFTICGEK